MNQLSFKPKAKLFRKLLPKQENLINYKYPTLRTKLKLLEQLTSAQMMAK